MSAMLMATPAALGSAAAPGLSVLTSLTPAGARRLAPAPSCRLHPGEQQQQQHKHLVRSPLAVTSRNRRWLVRSLPGLACFLSFFPLEFYRRRKWAVCALDGVRDKRYEALDEGLLSALRVSYDFCLSLSFFRGVWLTSPFCASSEPPSLDGERDGAVERYALTLRPAAGVHAELAQLVRRGLGA